MEGERVRCREGSGKERGKVKRARGKREKRGRANEKGRANERGRKKSEEHTSELQSRPHISYAVFCLKKKKQNSRIEE